ncbi:MAG: chromosome partitioning protein ParA [Bdellovibrionaceae bacterium]|nr:chromosome partitioning protein ParA [Pseudobdellovibrionaceae bacterium]|tara:strand:- start:49357 stop:50103 length:747 start_codon:yes stop_codon:yes gene_type:complete
MSIISVINQKGGVAKTTTSINIASSWSKRGKKVLLIDLDPQSSATHAIFGDKEFDNTVFDILINRLSPEEAVVHSEAFDIDVIPSEIMLSGVDIQLAAHYGRERILKKALESIKRKYDVIIIDCSPSLGLLTVNALLASKDIIIPICPEYFSLKGIELILETLKNLRVGLGHKLNVQGIVITRYRNRKVTNDVIKDVREKIGLNVFDSFIPDNISVEEAHHRHIPVHKYAPSSKGAKAYNALSKEIKV